MKSKIAIFLSYASIMMAAIFIPIYAKTLGASRVEIGLIGAAYGTSLFFSSYIFSRASDIKGRKRYVVFGLLLSAFAFFLPIISRSPLSLLVFRAIAGFSLGVFTAPLIAYAFESGNRMGVFSSYGSLGWAVGSLLAGVIAQKSEGLVRLSVHAPIWAVFTVSSLLFLLSFFIVLKLPENEFRPRKLPLFPRNIFSKNLKIYVSAFLRNFGAYSIWIIFPLFLAELGASKLWIGVLYFINMGGQAVIMRRLDFAKETTLIKTGLFLSGVIFFFYTLVPDYRWVIPLQVLLAFSYSFLYVGDLLYLIKRNEEKAVSVGILNSILGVCIGLGPLFGGMLSQIWSFEGVMYSASLLAFIALLVMIKEE
jgi:MFS family permease